MVIDKNGKIFGERRITERRQEIEKTDKNLRKEPRRNCDRKK